MMSKTLIYAVNTATQSIADGGTINFGNVIRKYGCLSISGGNVSTNCDGYYDIDVNLTVSGTAAGTANVQVYSNGTALPGAIATVPTTATSVTSVCIPTVIRQKCCVPCNITVIVSGTSVNITNSSIRVVKE